MIIDDRDWLRDQIDKLTALHEHGRADPWSPEDAPANFIAGQMKGIVGIEISIEFIEGKWKASQNQPVSNQIGVEQGLRADGHGNMADEVAARRNRS